MDEDLDFLRKKRMAELQGSQNATGYGTGDGSDEQKKVEMEKKRNDFKNNVLSQVLDQDARARLSTIALTKPEKAQMVENILIQMVQSGQITGKLGEDQLKNLLEQVNQKTNKQTTVKFDRRRAALDSDDDY